MFVKQVICQQWWQCLGPAASSSNSVLGMFSILMLVSSSTNATASLDACDSASDQCMPQGGVCCQCESCMDRIAAPLHVFSGSLVFSDMRSLPLHTVHACTVVQCLHLPHGDAVDLSALHGAVVPPGCCALCSCSSMLGAASSLVYCGAVCAAFVTVCAVTSLHLLRCGGVIAVNAVTSLVYSGECCNRP